MTALPWVIGGNSVNDKLQRVFHENTPLTTLYDFDGSNLPIYIGEAIAGTLTSETGWRIQKRGYNGSGRLISIKWANGDGRFHAIYDNRAGFSYS